MKTYQNIINVAMFGCLLLTVPACNEDEYAPGNPTAAGNMGVYFAGDNAHEFIKDQNDEKSMQIRLYREVTTEAASVPIQVVSKSDGINVPATAEFKSGEAETEITVTYNELVPGLRCELSIPEAYANPYKIKQGSSFYTLSVYRLILLSDNVTYQAMNGTKLDIFSEEKSSIYQMEGENKFIWRNFMGSGVELRFKIDGTFDKENVLNSYGTVVPLNHFYNEQDTDTGEDLGWYLTEEENGDFDDCTLKSWTPAGSDTPVENYMFFYYPYNGYSYFTIDFSDYYGDGYGYGTIESAVIDESGNYNSYYFYINY